MPGYDVARVEDIIAAHARLEGPLLPILHAVQEALGHIPDAAVRQIALALNLSRAEVHGVITFYADFRREPPARRVLKLCRAEACQARGGDAVAARAEQALGVAMGETRADGLVALEAVYCLGLCASGPAALVDEQPVARLAGERLERLLAEVAR
ncbi:MAG: formate dehydrogenase subunit gamma [Phenylobacterium sp.]